MARIYVQVALLVLCLWAACDRASAKAAGPQSPDSAFQDFNKYKVLAKNEHVEHRRIEPATLLSKRLSNGDRQANSTAAFNGISQYVMVQSSEDDETELIADANQPEPKIPTTYLMPKQSEGLSDPEAPPPESKSDLDDILDDSEDVDLENLPTSTICAKVLDAGLTDEEIEEDALQNAGLDFLRQCKKANFPEKAEGKISLVKVRSPSGEQRNELWYM